MVGDGAAFEDVKKKIEDEKLEDYVDVYGMQDGVRKFYKIADVTLICSLREGLTLTTYESLSMGTPVVSCNIGGQKELISKDVGVLVRPYQMPEQQFDFDYSADEIEEYKNAILKILENENKINYEEICREKVVKDFSINKMINDMDKYLTKLIKSKSKVNPSYCNSIGFAERYLLVNSMLEALNKSIEEKNKEIGNNG